MASKQELEAMGIRVMQCKECCRDISEEEYNTHNGYCKSCYADRKSIESSKRNFNNDTDRQIEYESDNTKINTVAKIIKIIAILEGIVSIILGFMFMEDLELYSLIIILVGGISAIFVYAIGEIIQLLEDIKNK